MIPGAELFKRVGIGFLMLDHLARRVMEWEEDFVKMKAKFGRRIGDNMSIIAEGEALLKLIPLIEKTITDAKALEQTPGAAALVADLEAIYATVKASIPEAPADPTPAPQPPAAA